MRLKKCTVYIIWGNGIVTVEGDEIIKQKDEETLLKEEYIRDYEQAWQRSHCRQQWCTGFTVCILYNIW